MSRLTLAIGVLLLSGVPSWAQAPFHAASLTLTDTQVKSLPTTPVELVAAPGVDRIAIPTLALVYFHHTADYSNIDPNAVLGIGSFEGGDEFLSVLRSGQGLSEAQVESLLAVGQSRLAVYSLYAATDGVSLYAAVRSIGPIADYANQPLNLTAYNEASGDFTGGHPDNTVSVNLVYLVFNTATGAFE